MACFFSDKFFFRIWFKVCQQKFRNISSLGLACQIEAWQEGFFVVFSLGHHVFSLLQCWGGFVENEDGQFGL